MNLLGDKVNCKRMAKQSGTPIFPGTDGGIEDLEEAVKVAAEIGYPVIVKAAGGGGGRGMRIARDEAELRAGVDSARQEAAAAFGNPMVYVEKYLEQARHFEVQVIGDNHGNSIHLYERDCSSQRRHQKLIEEAPAPGVDPAKRDRVCASAAALIRNAKYCGAATCEFLMDKDQNFYMLEVNTRVQVEHPISEAITGVDIVQTGIRVAAGEKLPYRQEDIRINGHAIEFRINAEDPDRNFMPQAGLVETWAPPGGPGIRMDSHVRAGYRVPPNYDSMVGKLIVHAPDRATCIQRSLGALKEFKVGPIKTTIPLHMRLLREPQFVNATHDIKYVERLLAAK
jgi:acetyl-CoA carboxylase biotin carboxylase subunit